MRKLLRRALRRRKYGEPVIVVSGLPRSGTSMMMRVLHAGGFPLCTDETRKADEDNPVGYFELERVKRLEQDGDRSWLRESRGQALKVISHLIRFLPDDCFYRILFMQRDLTEVIASQNKMLERRGESNPIADERALGLYRRHLVSTRLLARGRANMELLEIEYAAAVADPEQLAARVLAFLAQPAERERIERMAHAIDPSLYRNRREALTDR